MSKCVPELYRSVVFMIYRYSVCSFHYLVLSELVQYLTLYLVQVGNHSSLPSV